MSDIVCERECWQETNYLSQDEMMLELMMSTVLCQKGEKKTKTH